MNKRYYWLRLNKEFFKRHDIRVVEAMPNGKDYILFYLKLLVESIDHEGELRFSETIPYSDEMLSVVTNTNVDIVRSALKIFTELEMIEILDDETIFMTEVEKMLGTSSQDDHTRESTRLRVQKHREKQKMLQERYSNVTCNGEIELEIEKEIELEIDIEKDKDISINNTNVQKTTHEDEIKKIIDYLNQRVGSHLTYRNKQNNSYINARLNEGFTIDDFFTVIDKKAGQWLGNPKMSKFLVPSTLFAPSHFENYLNEVVASDEKSSEATFDAVSDWLTNRG